MRAIGLILTALGGLAIAGELKGLAFPTARWFFATSREISWLHSGTFLWFGWLSAALLILSGLTMIVRSFTGGPPDPITARRIKRFREIKRGYYSLLILIGLIGLAALDQVVVGKRALAIRQGGEWRFPAFMPYDLKNKDIGITGEREEAAADYRLLKRSLPADSADKVIMPLIPFDPTGDTLPPLSQKLDQRDGIYYEHGSDKPFFGLVAKYYDVDQSSIHLRYTMRHGRFNGPADGWDDKGRPIYNAEYRDGVIANEHFNGGGAKEDFLALKTSDLRAVRYHPAPPLPETGHFLGTTSQGYDLLAYLFGGLQVNLKSALIYLPVVYLIGITLGMLMGYFGGWFDITVDRLIEIFSNMPFLFIVIILSSMVPEQFKGFPVSMTIMILFGWMGITSLMRTAAYRDKTRDYISAARVLGAGTPRIIFRHLIPNTVANIVTLIPFTLSSLIFSFTALDYLGFGLPPEYATWGRLLNDGLSNLSAPWLVSSTFIALVTLLVLITFVGEAIREAFDPKKFTYYR